MTTRLQELEALRDALRDVIGETSKEIGVIKRKENDSAVRFVLALCPGEEARLSELRSLVRALRAEGLSMTLTVEVDDPDQVRSLPNLVWARQYGQGGDETAVTGEVARCEQWHLVLSCPRPIIGYRVIGFE